MTNPQKRKESQGEEESTEGEEGAAGHASRCIMKSVFLKDNFYKDKRVDASHGDPLYPAVKVGWKK